MTSKLAYKGKRLGKEELAKARKVLITEYLESLDVKLEIRNDRARCISPLTHENNPSFWIYPENKFYDFSSGSGGDIIDLVRLIEGYNFADAVKFLLDFDSKEEFDETKYERNYYSYPDLYGHFKIDTFETKSSLNVQVIEAYANKRGLAYGSYMPSLYKSPVDIGEGRVIFVDKLAVGFPHTDEFGMICGIKMRSVDGDDEPRFIHRGKTGFYVLENITDLKKDPVLYIVESETSASSLMKYLRDINENAVVISFGGVNQVPDVLPFKWEYLTNRKLIIDWDGDGRLWATRSAKFKHLHAEDIKLEFDKGKDLNSICVSGEIKDYLP